MFVNTPLNSTRVSFTFTIDPCVKDTWPRILIDISKRCWKLERFCKWQRWLLLRECYRYAILHMQTHKTMLTFLHNTNALTIWIYNVLSLIMSMCYQHTWICCGEVYGYSMQCCNIVHGPLMRNVGNKRDKTPIMVMSYKENSLWCLWSCRLTAYTKLIVIGEIWKYADKILSF